MHFLTLAERHTVFISVWFTVWITDTRIVRSSTFACLAALPCPQFVSKMWGSGTLELDSATLPTSRTIWPITGPPVQLTCCWGEVTFSTWIGWCLWLQWERRRRWTRPMSTRLSCLSPSACWCSRAGYLPRRSRAVVMGYIVHRPLDTGRHMSASLHSHRSLLMHIGLIYAAAPTVLCLFHPLRKNWLLALGIIELPPLPANPSILVLSRQMSLQDSTGVTLSGGIKYRWVWKIICISEMVQDRQVPCYYGNQWESKLQTFHRRPQDWV